MDVSRGISLAPAEAESPASRVLDQAIELAIEEKCPFPEKALFLNVDVPPHHREAEMERAAGEGVSVVLVSPDLTTQVVLPEEILGRDAA
jgi:hypothetical protein